MFSLFPLWIIYRCSVVTKPRETLFQHILRGVLFYLVVAMRYGLLDLIIDGLKWLFADKKERAFMSIPYNCQCCELLGICRGEENNWKCRNGCIIINRQKNDFDDM